MKNNRIEHAFNEAKIYKQYYRPSFNPFRFLRSILSVLIGGSSVTVHHYHPGKKKSY